MEFNWCTLYLCLEEYAKKYFRVLIDDVVNQVYPIISLFCKYHFNTIINFNLSRLPSDFIFAL